MSNLTLTGLPTTPEQKAFIEDFGFRLTRTHDRAGCVEVEVWTHTDHTEEAPYMFVMRHGGVPGTGEFFSYGKSSDVTRIHWVLFPEQAEKEFGSRVYHMVMGSEQFLGFNLNKFTGTEIVEALRQLAKTKMP